MKRSSFLGLLFLPLLFVAFSFAYVAWFFEISSWAYVGTMLLWVTACLSGFAIARPEFPVVLSRSTRVVDKEVWDAVLLGLGALAILSLFYDRIALRGIDYLGGVAEARETLNAGSYATSVFGVFGNIFLYAFLFPVIRCLVGWEDKPRRNHWLILAVAAVELAGVTYLMGGRTAILLTIAFGLACLLVRPLLGKSFLPAPLAFRHLAIFGLCVFVVFTLFFWLRSDAFTGGDSLAYYRNMCGHLTSGTALECDFGTAAGPLKDILNYGHLVLLYGTHGVWFSNDIVQNAPSDGWVTVQGIFTLILNRLGVESPEFAHAGYFIPAPAALVHDVGYTGMLLFGFLFGVAMGWIFAGLKALRSHVWMYLSVFGISFWLLSFLIFPLNLLGFLITGVLGILLLCMHGLRLFLTDHFISRTS